MKNSILRILFLSSGLITVLAISFFGVCFEKGVHLELSTSVTASHCDESESRCLKDETSLVVNDIRNERRSQDLDIRCSVDLNFNQGILAVQTNGFSAKRDFYNIVPLTKHRQIQTIIFRS